MIARVTMGRRFAHLTEGLRCSALITNCNCYEDISDKLGLHKTLKLGIILRVHENLECVLGPNSDQKSSSIKILEIGKLLYKAYSSSLALKSSLPFLENFVPCLKSKQTPF